MSNRNSMRARTYFGPRPLTTTIPHARNYKPPTSLTVPTIKSSQIVEIKLQTQQKNEEIKRLKTVLTRMKHKISANTTSINKTFEISTEGPTTSQTIHQNTIAMLKQSIEKTNNSLDSLRQQIEAAKNDDRLWNVKELEEDTKTSYLEYCRIKNEISKNKQESQDYQNKRNRIEFLVSQEHMADTRALLKESKDTNRILRDKYIAYQKKTYKVLIEIGIVNRRECGTDSLATIEEAEIEQAEDNNKLTELYKQLDERKEQHEKNKAELMEILKKHLANLEEVYKKKSG